MIYLAKLLARRVPTWALVPLGALVALVWLVVEIARRPVLLFACCCSALGWWAVARYGAVGVGTVALVVVSVLGIALGAGAWLAPSTFERVLGGPARSWRRRRYYAARWADAMDGAGLVRAETEPVLMSCRSSGGIDRLTVHMAPGQLVTEWRDAAPRLVTGLEVRSVRVRRDGPRDVVLLVRRWLPAVDPGGDPVRVAGPEIPAEELVDAEPEQPATPGAFPRRPA